MFKIEYFDIPRTYRTTNLLYLRLTGIAAIRFSFFPFASLFDLTYGCDVYVPPPPPPPPTAPRDVYYILFVRKMRRVIIYELWVKHGRIQRDVSGELLYVENNELILIYY